MHRFTARALALAIGVIASFPAVAPAQSVLGPGDDALVLPRGVFRIRVLDQRTTFNERYGSGTPGRPEGALEPLAIDFNLDTIGTEQFRNLGVVQQGFRNLTGMPDFRLSLGRTVVTSSGNVIANPVVFEAGLTNKVSAGLTIPIVHTRNDIFFDVNPTGREGNVGFNPAAAVAAAATQNATLVAQLQGAATALETAVGGCGTITAANANACSLIGTTRAFAGGIAQLYGVASGAGFAGSPFVPIAGTEAQATIEARIAAIKAQYPGAIGGAITIAGPFAAQNRLTVSDAQRILTDPTFGVNGEPLQTVETTRLGDIEFGVKYLFLDSFKGDHNARYTAKGFNYRSAVTGFIRLGTGKQDRPENFVDIGSGNGQTDLELRSSTDVVWGTRFWNSFTLRLGMQLADKEEMRIIDEPDKRLAAAWRQQEVDRDLGDYFEIENSPRVAINDWFQLAGFYLYRHKYKDEYEGRFAIPDSVTGFTDPASSVPGHFVIDAATLNLETEQTEHRLGAGFSFSTLAAFNKQQFKVPLEVTFLHWQTTRGSGGSQPKFFTNQIQLRLYTRLFGG
jgi:hypothetical protein